MLIHASKRRINQCHKRAPLWENYYSPRGFMVTRQLPLNQEIGSNLSVGHDKLGDQVHVPVSATAERIVRGCRGKEKKTWIRPINSKSHNRRLLEEINWSRKGMKITYPKLFFYYSLSSKHVWPVVQTIAQSPNNEIHIVEKAMLLISQYHNASPDNLKWIRIMEYTGVEKYL